MFERITVIGMGLIGSSITRAVQKHGLAKTLVAVDFDKDVCQTVIDLKLADFVTSEPAEGVKDSDLVILCVPVGAMAAVVKAMVGSLKEGAIVSDVGSVKVAVIDAVKAHLPSTVEFVPAHPIAGTEFSGPKSGFPELFIGRWCILTPLPESSIRAVEKLTKFWEAIGARIEIMGAKHHDMVLGITSHLPHLIAYTIVGTASELEDDTKSEVIKFSASGFRDFTRIASSDPTMWRDVFLNNKEAVLELLQRFTEDLTAVQKAIRQGDGDYLYNKFDKTRAIRKAIIDQGQA